MQFFSLLKRLVVLVLSCQATKNEYYYLTLNLQNRKVLLTLNYLQTLSKDTYFFKLRGHFMAFPPSSEVRLSFHTVQTVQALANYRDYISPGVQHLSNRKKLTSFWGVPVKSNLAALLTLHEMESVSTTVINLCFSVKSH